MKPAANGREHTSRDRSAHAPPARPLPRYASCFVCGRANAAGLNLRFAREGKIIRADWIPEEKHLGYRDRVHGGVVAAVLDEAMGWAPAHLKGRLYYSAEITVRYRKPVPAGLRLRVEAEVAEDRGRLVRSRGRILGADGTVYATSSGTYVPLSGEETRAVLDYLEFDGSPARRVTPEDF